MSLSYAILAALADRACSGYDIAKKFESSVGFFWQATHQQIYRELTKLEDKGWISAELIPQEGRPNKKLYSLIKLGQQQMAEWIAQPGKPSPIKDELLVKFFAGYLVDPQVLLAELEHHRQLHQGTLSTYQDIERQYFQNPQELPLAEKCRYLTLRNGIRYETEWLAWYEEAEAMLKAVKKDEV